MRDFFEPSWTVTPAFKVADHHLIWRPFVQLAVMSNVPTRPTAEVIIKYDTDAKAVCCDVREGPQTNTVARYGDSGLQFLSRRYQADGREHTDTWLSPKEAVWVPIGSPPMTDREAMCLKVLQNSDVYCPRQARSDFPKAVESGFWAALLNEMVRLFFVASVLCD